MPPWTNKKPILIVDASNMCWKNFHAMKKAALRAGDVQTGMLYGVFRDIITLAEYWMTDQFVWCFDSVPTLRKRILPEYKENRKPRTEQETELRVAVGRQIEHLQELLKVMGFRNIFRHRGFEADDLVAQTVLNGLTDMPDGDFVIVSGDKDLLQCLFPQVKMYDMRSGAIMSKKRFIKKYGIRPRNWAMVKAMAGCSGDNVPGLRSIGGKTAIKFIQDNTSVTPRCRAIIDGGTETIKRNLKLVGLPFFGCPELTFRKDKVTAAKWTAALSHLNMDSLVRKYPF